MKSWTLLGIYESQLKGSQEMDLAWNIKKRKLKHVDILGVAKSNIATVVIETKRYRDLGMSENLVVIEDIDEYAYCLDTSNVENNNECPVIAWNKQGGLDDYNSAENFYEFLSQRLFDAKEAWEEDF